MYLFSVEKAGRVPENILMRIYFIKEGTSWEAMQVANTQEIRSQLEILKTRKLLFR